ncbi:MAG TPA: nuclear transport factor 2 family protein [Phenylobacterium sp.]
MNATANLSPAEIAQGQLDAYNAQDLHAFVQFYADDVVIANLNGDETERGIAALRERYAKLFAAHPQNRVELLGRIAVGNTVIDHEKVVRAPGGETFEVAAIYTIAGGKIARADFAK